MTHFLITMAGSFLGTIAALLLWTMYKSIAGSDASVTSAEHSHRVKWVALLAIGTFAVVAGLIFYFISTGDMSAGLGAIAAIVTLVTLSLVARALR